VREKERTEKRKTRGGKGGTSGKGGEKCYHFLKKRSEEQRDWGPVMRWVGEKEGGGESNDP